MPLQNLGRDPADDYFADGIVEDIIVSLSALRELMVISRTSTVTLKQRPMNVQEIGRALGVSYVVTGSVRRSPTALRVTVQLSDAETGANLWADTVEGPIGELFALQDRIVRRLAGGLAPQVRDEELRRALRKRPDSITAYDYTLRALDVINSLNQATFARAREYLERAMADDPQFAMPVAWAARWHSLNIGQGWSDDREGDMARALELSAKAVQLDCQDALVLATYAHLRSYLLHDYDAALVYFDRALNACANSMLAWVLSAATLSYVGRGDEAIRHAEYGLQLSPADQRIFQTYNVLGWAHYAAGNYETAAKWARMSASENPKYTANLRLLAGTLTAAGQREQAHEVALCLLRIDPRFNLRSYEATVQPFRAPEIKSRFLRHLAEAGLPD